jgi:dihydrofolate reductase
MRKIILFQNVSLDGFFEGPGHDISGFQDGGSEGFGLGGGEENDAILLGHRTYDLMKIFWPTPQAAEAMPEIAAFMNDKVKFTVSHKSFAPGWRNVQVVSGDVIAQLRQIKQGPGKNIISFGSNTLCTSLLQEGLLDEVQILLNPVVLGAGTSLFAGLQGKVKLRLKNTHSFESGKVLLFYEPAGK